MTQYCCPDCDRVVWHRCQPLVYRRRLPREGPLRALRPIRLEEAEYPSLEESWHGTFAATAGGYRPPSVEQARAETGQGKRGKAYTPKGRARLVTTQYQETPPTTAAPTAVRPTPRRPAFSDGIEP